MTENFLRHLRVHPDLPTGLGHPVAEGVPADHFILDARPRQCWPDVRKVNSENLGKFLHLLFSLSSTLFHATDREKFPPTEAMGLLAWGGSAILSITNRTICLNKRKQKLQRVAGAL